MSEARGPGDQGERERVTMRRKLEVVVFDNLAGTAWVVIVQEATTKLTVSRAEVEGGYQHARRVAQKMLGEARLKSWPTRPRRSGAQPERWRRRDHV